MEMVLMTESHFAAADELRRLAGWNQRPEGWARLLALEPEGCFATIENGELIGTVTAGTYGRRPAGGGKKGGGPEQHRRGGGAPVVESALGLPKDPRGAGCRT